MKIKISVIACCLSLNFLSLAMQRGPQLYEAAENNAQRQFQFSMLDNAKKDMSALISEIGNVYSVSEEIIADICARCDVLRLEEKQLIFKHLCLFNSYLLTKRKEFTDMIQMLFPHYDYKIPLCDSILENENDITEKGISRTTKYITCNTIVDIGMDVACIITPSIASVLSSHAIWSSIFSGIAVALNAFSSFYKGVNETLLEKVTHKKLIQILRADRKLFNSIGAVIWNCKTADNNSINLAVPMLLKLYSSDLAVVEMNAKKLLGYRFVQMEEEENHETVEYAQSSEHMFRMDKVIAELKPYNVMDFLYRKACNIEYEKLHLVKLCLDTVYGFGYFFAVIGIVSPAFSTILINVISNLRNPDKEQEPVYKQIMQSLVLAKISLDLIASIAIICRNSLLGEARKRTKDLESNKTIGALCTISKSKEVPAMVTLCETIAVGEVPQGEQLLHSESKEVKLPVFRSVSKRLMASMEKKTHGVIAPVAVVANIKKDYQSNESVEEDTTEDE